MSDRPDRDGKFTVAVRQLVGGNIRAWIDVIFGPGEDFTRFEYKTQDAVHETRVSGSHGEPVIDVKIYPTQKS
ncbi:MAG TPA: hypothetical protein VG206_14815 [Terriglobia bacterium]|nr:hypothetical protein [Terriglobia bacterium]